MTILAGINRFIALFVETAKQLGRKRIWFLLFGYFLLNWLVLYAHYNFMSPVFSGFIRIWTGLFGEDQAVAERIDDAHVASAPGRFFDARPGKTWEILSAVAWGKP